MYCAMYLLSLCHSHSRWAAAAVQAEREPGCESIAILVAMTRVSLGKTFIAAAIDYQLAAYRKRQLVVQHTVV